MSLSFKNYLIEIKKKGVKKDLTTFTLALNLSRFLCFLASSDIISGQRLPDNDAMSARNANMKKLLVYKKYNFPPQKPLTPTYWTEKRNQVRKNNNMQGKWCAAADTQIGYGITDGVSQAVDASEA